MMTFLHVKPLAFAVRTNLLPAFRFSLVYIILLAGAIGTATAQTTYTWNATAGGSWATATNWTPTRTTPAVTDILQFTDGGTYTVTSVPTQTIRQLFVTNNTNVTLQSAVAATVSINGPASTDNLSVTSGATLNLGGANALGLAFLTTTTQRGTIAGTLNLSGTSNTFTTTVITTATGVTVTGNITCGAGGTVTGSAASLNFASGGIYNHNRNGGAIPTATWNAASVLNVTGITNTALTAFTGTFGIVNWNSPSQTLVSPTTGTTTVAGNLNVIAGNFSSGNNALTVTGTTGISSGATLTHGTAAKGFTGDITNDGTWNETAAGTYAIAGNLTNNGTFTASTGVHTFSGTAKNLSGSSDISIPSVTVSGTYTNNNSVTVGTALAGAGGLTLGTNTTLTIGGTSTITTLNCTTNTPNTVIYSGTAAQTIKLNTYHHLTVDKGSGAVASIAAGTTTVNGNVAILNGVLSDGGNTLAVTASGQVNVSDGAIYRTLKTANFFPTNLVFSNLNFNTSGGFDYAATTASSYNLPSTPTTYGTLYISAGGSAAPRLLTADINVYSLSVSASLLNENGFAINGNAAGTFTLGANGVININHPTQNFPSNFISANVSLNAASTVNYAYNGNQIISSVPALYGNLTTSTAGTKSLAGDVAVGGVVTVNTGTILNLQGNTLSISGGTSSITLNGSLAADVTGSTLRFNGSGSQLQQVSLPVAKLVNGYIANLVCANTGTSITQLGSATQVTNLTINSGATLNLNGQTAGVSGVYNNAGSIQGATTTSILLFNGTGGPQSFAMGTVSGINAIRLAVNNAGGVNVSAASVVGGLDFIAGLVNTTASNLLTINTTTTIGTVTGASNTMYVNGPVARRFASGTTSGTYSFPTGKSGLNSFAITTPVVSGSTDIVAEVFDMGSGGTGGPGFLNPSLTRFWRAQVVAGSVTSVTNVQLTENGLVVDDAIGQSATQTGVYQLIGGVVAGSTITSEVTPTNTLGYFTIGKRDPLSGTVEVGPGSVNGYFTFTANGGLFQAINVRGLGGNLTVNVVGDISIEDGTNALNQWSEYYGSGYTITVQSNIAGNRTISGAYNGSALTNSGLIRLNGASRVTFNGGAANNRYLTFRNTSSGATFISALGLYGDAANNTFNNCIFEAGSTGASNIVGVIYFNSTGGSVGVDNNTIRNCDIRDLTTATSYPRFGITSLGVASAINNSNTIQNCNIFNFYLSGAGTTGTAGIWVSNYNSDWTITGNNIYQAVSRTTSAASNFEGIRVEGTGVGTAGTSSTGHRILSNKIGGSGRDAFGNITGNWSDNGTVANRFRGIAISQASGTTGEVDGNIISGFTLSSSSGATSAPGVFGAIHIGGGNVSVGTTLGNTIGDTTGQDKIVITISTAGGISYGIVNASTGTVSINKNLVGAITTLGNAATISHSFYAINNSSGTGTATINDNLIGSVSTARSIRANTVTTVTAAGTAQTVVGIYSTSNAGANITINGNKIRSLYANSTTATTSTLVRGIELSGGANYTVANNTIFNIESEATNSGTVLSAAIIGILNNQNVGGTTTRVIDNNVIYGLQSNSASSTATHIYGIVLNVTAGTPTNTVTRNFIHSFNSPNNTSTTTEQTGIYVTSTTGGTYSNNMIRLGTVDGVTGSQPHIITGILDASTNTASYYHNTVVIAGTASAGAVNTYAYRRSSASGAKDTRNNIFVNIRTGGTGVHFAFASNTATGYTTANFDYNIFHSATNTEFSIAATPTALTGATAALRIQNMRSQTAGGNNLHSGIATLSQINFLNVNGTPALVNLRLANANCASGAGISVAGVSTDIDGVITRAATPAIGAHESAAFNTIDATYDIYTPNFIFTAIPVQSSACVPTPPIVVDVTITDLGTGVQTTAGNEPQMWWRLSTGTYASVAGVFQSGTANNGVWRFTINPALSIAETYQYYFVAEDKAGTVNRWFSAFNATTPVHPSVTSQTTPPATPHTFSTASLSPLGGTVNVGTGQTYTSLNSNSSTGFFYDLMQRGLKDNLEVLVTSDLNENGLYTVLGVVTEYCGSNYTVTIKPSAATNRNITQSSGGNPLINLQGCQRITFDGSFGGSGRYLTFAGRQATATIYFNGVSSRATGNIQFKNCIIEGNCQLTNSIGPGVINFAGLLGTGSSIENIVIDNNIIRNRSDIAQSTLTAPNVLINIGGESATNTPIKSNITISNNEMFNFTRSGIWIQQNTSGNGIGNNITITGNKIYEVMNFSTYQYPIWLEGGVNSKGHIISNNLIGGNAAPSPTISGTWTNTRTDGEIVPIYTLNGGTSINDGVTISNNTIANLTITGTSYTNFIGIRNEYGYTKISNNTVNNINNYGSGDPLDVTANSATIGIWNQDENEALIEGNTISNMRAYYSTGVVPYQYVVGIQHGSNNYLNGSDYTNYPGGKGVVRNNSVLNLSSGSLLANPSTSPDALIGIFFFAANGTTGNELSGNTVSGLRLTEAWTNATNNTRVYAIGIGLGQYGSTQSGIVANNKIYDINNNCRANAPEINGLLIGGGNWSAQNNMISLTNSVYPNAYPLINGIYDWMTIGRTGSFYNNTVFIGGTVGAGGINSSYAYVRLPNGLANVRGANVTIQNNIFLNDRTGNSTNNVAVGNLTTLSSSDAAIGWNSNYNFLSTRNTNQIGRWVGTAAGDRTFANWKSTSGGDASSWSVGAANTSDNTQLNYADLFTDAANGDLSIKANSQAAWFVNGKGVAGALASDIQGDVRTTTYGLGIDIGADEFTPTVLPHALTATPTLNGTNTFTFAGRTIGKITWGGVGTVPTLITARYYSGDEPGTTPSPAFGGMSKADFMTEFTPTGGSGYTYTATLNYDGALTGTYANNEGNMEMIKTASVDWVNVPSTVDTVNKVLSSASSLSAFSFFSAGVEPTPLPIQLLSFEAQCEQDRVKLTWSTATEINNEKFIIHRSTNLIDWDELTGVPGAGNSNQVRHYQTVDDRPLQGMAYYRLTQRDYDGSSESFNPISVNCVNDGEGNGISVYPNPATDHFTVSVLMNTSVNNATLDILDMNGKTIASRNVNLAAGTTEFNFDIHTMSAGTYVVRLVAAGAALKPVKLIIK